MRAIESRNQPRQPSGGGALDRLIAQRQQEKDDDEGGGFAGVFGAVLNNPIARGILRPLQVFDTGRSAAVSGVREIVDALDTDPNTTPSLTDFATQGRQHIGFGTAFPDPTGIGWLDKGIGFTGDVALDPLTYVTFGAGRFAGAGGRLAAAGELAAKAADPTVDAATQALARQAVEKVGRLGVGALSAEERALIPRLGEAGLRFMGKRIPGTTGIAEDLGSLGGQARAALHRTRVGQALRRGPGRSPDIQRAMDRLLGGKGDLDPLEAAGRYAFHITEKSASGRFRSRQVQRAHALDKALRHSAKARSELTHAIETGDLSNELVQQGTDLYQTIWDEAVYEGGINLDSLGPTYMPHRLTAHGQDVLKKSDVSDQIVTNKGGAAAAQRHRVILPGQKLTIGGKTATVPESGRTIRGLNEWLDATFDDVKGKVFEDDFVLLTDTYIDEVSRQVGRAAGFRGLVERGVARLPDDPDVLQPDAAGRRFLMDEAEMAARQEENLATSRAFRPLWEETQPSPNGFPTNGDRTRAQMLSSDPEVQRLFQEAVEQRGVASEVDILAAQADETPRGVAIAAEGDEAFDYDAFLQAALAGEYDDMVKYELKNGFERVGQELLAGGEGVVVTTQMADALRNVQKALDKGWVWRGVDGYTQFFKQYATLSPGFHFRNAMSATFMNLADGVSLRSMQQGIREWRRYLKDPSTYVDDTPLDQRKLLTEALDAVYGGGGGSGQYSADELVSRGFGSKNALVRASRRVGSEVEGVVRMGMALDTLKKGGSVAEAAARIARVHFDYSELSNLDRTMKRIVPFWTFMSRNLPLQTQQMWLKPRLYQQYQSLVRNMGQDYEEDIVPLSWQRMDAFKLSDGTYLAPDFAHTRQLQDIEQLGDFPAALSDVNPAFRLPLELWAGENFFSGHEFRPNTFEELTFADSPEIAGLRPVLDLLGQVEQAGPQGNIPVIDERLGYVLRQLLPTLAQGQRIIPSQDPYYGDRTAQSLLNFAGVPLKQLSEGQVTRERERRLFEEGLAESRNRARAEALRRFGLRDD